MTTKQMLDEQFTPEQEEEVLRHMRDGTAGLLIDIYSGQQLRVVRAAILDEHGGVHSVPRPGRHNDVINQMVECGLPTPITGEQGFVLSDGQFVRRKAAARVAVKAGQCGQVELPSTGLLSEDVW